MTATPALAVDGTITIAGELVDSTCKINGNDPPYNLLVRLPTISAATALKKVGDTAGATLFTIKLTECPESFGTKEIGLYFEPGPTTDYVSKDLIAYTPSGSDGVSAAATSIPSERGTQSTLVQIRLSNLDGTKILMGNDASTQNTAKVALASNAADLRHLASYVRVKDGSVSAGHIVSYVRYSIVYP